MLTTHHILAFAVLAVTCGRRLWGLWAFRRRRAGATLGHVLVLAQTVLIAQVGLASCSSRGITVRPTGCITHTGPSRCSPSSRRGCTHRTTRAGASSGSPAPRSWQRRSPFVLT